MSHMSNKQKHIVVLGGGFAGLTFAKNLRHPNARITLVDRQNHHLFQPLLYQVATAGLTTQDIAEPLRTILAGREDVHILMDTVEQIDVHQKQVKLANQTLAYDYLVIGLGMVNSYFGNDHWAQHTIGLKTLADARAIRERVLSAFERAEVIEDEEERRRLMTVVVVGGGPTGVEMAGALAELTKRVFKRDFRKIELAGARVVLVEAADRLLGTYAHQSSERAYKDLKKLGVELHLGKKVEDIIEGQVTFSGEKVQAANIVWTAGVEANPLLRDLPVERDRRGRVMVAPDGSLPGFPECFALGDIANLRDTNGVQVPGVSPAAIQMAEHAVKIVRAELDGTSHPQERKPFTYWDKGTMATIGRSAAVAEIGKLKFHGLIAWVLWLAVHLVFLIGFRNRVSVLLHWFSAYVTYRPAARVLETLSSSFAKNHKAAPDKPVLAK